MKSRLLAACAALAFSATPAQALVTTVQTVGATGASIENTGADFIGSLSFDDALARLTITLTNNSPIALGGFLTAFAFNAPAAATVSFASSTLTSFDDFFVGPNTNPFTGFEYGVGVGGNYNGGGEPFNGLAIGASATWTFDVSGGAFSASDFLTLGSGSTEAPFATRFRGLANGRSDKVPGAEVPITAIPEPETYALMLAGLGMVAFMSWRRRRD